MGRRSTGDGILDMLFEVASEVFSVVPAWTSLPLSALAWWLIAFGMNSKLPPGLHPLGHVVGGGIGVSILAGGVAGWLARRKGRQFLAAHIDLQWVRRLTWREFEEQVAAVYRRRGYSATLLGGGRPDEGIDVRLTRGGQATVVQCKHWQAWKVGVRVVRELLGAMSAERADAGILITSGRCTEAARRLAGENAITLIEREQFLDLVREFQRDLRASVGMACPEATRSSEGDAGASPPACPRCGSPMTLRTAHRGEHAGGSFWGCTRFPGCRGVRNL